MGEMQPEAPIPASLFLLQIEIISLQDYKDLTRYQHKHCQPTVSVWMDSEWLHLMTQLFISAICGPETTAKESQVFLYGSGKPNR